MIQQWTMAVDCLRSNHQFYPHDQVSTDQCKNLVT